MSRVKIKFPDEKPLFECSIPVRINDINYGNHVGNDSVLSIIHEARMQWLRSLGYSELDAGGNSLIMADVMIAYKGEGFYGDIFDVRLYAADVSDIGFNLLYRITTVRQDEPREIAHGKTGMLCYDYEKRKVVAMTDVLKNHLKG